MATTEKTTGAETGDQVVGHVAILYGTVKVISPDGTERLLTLNSPIFANDTIVTESDGRVSIVMDDGTQSQIDLGRMSEVIIDEDIYQDASSEEISDAATEVEQIQEALLAEDFDPTLELEAAAAGDEYSAGGGHPVPEFERITSEGEVTSGAETTGITGDTADPIPGIDDAQNSPPDANNDLAADDDSLTTSEDTALTIEPATLLNNDTDVDGDSLTITGYSQPSNGEVTTDTQGNLVYTPDADFNGHRICYNHG
jgi:hypothetical protein